MLRRHREAGADAGGLEAGGGGLGAGKERASGGRGPTLAAVAAGLIAALAYREAAHARASAEALAEEVRLLTGDVFTLEQEAFRRAGRGRVRDNPGGSAMDSVASLRAAVEPLGAVVSPGASEEERKLALIRAHRSAERASSRLRAAARAPGAPPTALTAWLALDAFAAAIGKCRPHLAAGDVERAVACVSAAAACADTATGGAAAVLGDAADAADPDATCLSAAHYSPSAAASVKGAVDSAEAKVASELQAAAAPASDAKPARKGVSDTGERTPAAYLADLAKVAARLAEELSDGTGATNPSVMQALLIQAHRRAERYAKEYGTDLADAGGGSVAENEAHARMQKVADALARARALWVSAGDHAELRHQVEGARAIALSGVP